MCEGLDSGYGRLPLEGNGERAVVVQPRGNRTSGKSSHSNSQDQWHPATSLKTPDRNYNREIRKVTRIRDSRIPEGVRKENKVNKNKSLGSFGTCILNLGRTVGLCGNEIGGGSLWLYFSAKLV